MTNLDSWYITLPTKVHLVKAMAFPVLMYGCESRTVKKAEHQIIDAFELWFWRRLLRVPWTARRSIQSVLKDISPGCSLEGLMWSWNPILWPPDVKSWFIWKDPDAGKDWKKRRRRQQRRRLLDGITNSMDMSLSNSWSWWWTVRPGMLLPWGHKEFDTTEWLNCTAIVYSVFFWLKNQCPLTGIGKGTAFATSFVGTTFV